MIKVQWTLFISQNLVKYIREKTLIPDWFYGISLICGVPTNHFYGFFTRYWCLIVSKYGLLALHHLHWLRAVSALRTLSGFMPFTLGLPVITKCKCCLRFSPVQISQTHIFVQSFEFFTGTAYSNIMAFGDYSWSHFWHRHICVVLNPYFRISVSAYLILRMSDTICRLSTILYSLLCQILDLITASIVITNLTVFIISLTLISLIKFV